MWIRRKKFNELKERLTSMMTALEKAKQHAHLIDIRRGGRKNIFIFQRGEKIIKIETMGLLSDDIKTWKDELIR